MKFMSDNGIIFDKMEDCQAFEANPSFIMYDADGQTTNDGDSAMLIQVKNEDGYYLCRELLERQDSPCRGLDREPGYYYWGMDEFVYLSENVVKMIQAIKK